MPENLFSGHLKKVHRTIFENSHAVPKQPQCSGAAKRFRANYEAGFHAAKERVLRRRDGSALSVLGEN